MSRIYINSSITGLANGSYKKKKENRKGGKRAPDVLAILNVWALDTCALCEQSAGQNNAERQACLPCSEMES